MYSMVLMLAMTHGAATPMPALENGADFNQASYGNHLRQEDFRWGRRRRRGRDGCGCCGGGGGGYSSYGCCGGGGGWGGCCGGGGWGGYSSCGCCGGGVVMSGPAWGGGGEGWGPGSMGAPPAGGNMGAPPAGGPGRVPMPAPRRGAGAQGTYQYNYGSGFDQGAPPAGGFNNGNAPNPGAGAPPAGNGATERINPPAGSQTKAPAPATFTVQLPADAKLMIDNQPTRSTSSTRTFITPPLPLGKAFTYTLKAQIKRDGKPVSQIQEVSVRAGQHSDVSVQFPEAQVTKK